MRLGRRLPVLQERTRNVVEKYSRGEMELDWNTEGRLYIFVGDVISVCKEFDFFFYCIDIGLLAGYGCTW